MSISPNVGAISGYLLRIARGQIYNRVRGDVGHILKKLPAGQQARGWPSTLEDGLKKALVPGNALRGAGVQLRRPDRRPRLPGLAARSARRRTCEGPVLLHVLHHEGQGLQLAEHDPVFWHGPSPFKVRRARSRRRPRRRPTRPSSPNAGRAGRERPADRRRSRPRCPMARADRFAKTIPGPDLRRRGSPRSTPSSSPRAWRRGLRPVCAIYSTFLQRAYDQIVHDVCLQDLPVVFALDRAGLVGEDGPTHHGVFDLSYLRVFPNIWSPRRRTRTSCATSSRPRSPPVTPRPSDIRAGRAAECRARPELETAPGRKGRGASRRAGTAWFSPSATRLPRLKAAEGSPPRGRRRSPSSTPDG